MNYKRKIILIFGMLLLAKTVFLLIQEDRTVHNYFPFSKAQCTSEEWVYYGFEHLIWIYVFGLMVFTNLNSIKKELEYFFMVAVIDFADYLLTYNSIWFRIGQIPISFNVLQFLIIGYVFVKANDDE